MAWVTVLLHSPLFPALSLHPLILALSKSLLTSLHHLDLDLPLLILPHQLFPASPSSLICLLTLFLQAAAIEAVVILWLWLYLVLHIIPPVLNLSFLSTFHLLIFLHKSCTGLSFPMFWLNKLSQLKRWLFCDTRGTWCFTETLENMP